MKYLLNSVLIIAAMSLFLVACQKESEVETPKKDKPVLVEEKPMMFYKSLQHGNKLKGFYGDETSTIYVKAGISVSIGETKASYKFMKVEKTDGTFMWVMLTNLRQKPKGYDAYIYGDEFLVPQTGYLYKWGTANTLAGLASASFPVLDANGVPTAQMQTITGARLLNMEDLYALFEYNTLGNLPQNTTPISSIIPEKGYKGYLDAFVFSDNKAANESGGNNILGGIRLPWEWLAEHGGTDGFVKYGGRYEKPERHFEKGMIWLDALSNVFSDCTTYYPLFIERTLKADKETYNPFTVFVNSGYNGEHAMSVRLVFDAVMQ